MNGIESEAVRFSHACARMNRALQEPLARVRRVEQHQQTMVNWLNPADQSPLETTIGFEQVAIEVTAALAQQEPDTYLAQVYRFGLLEDFDHMHRFAALLDRVEGKDANNLLQGYTDIRPGRPTIVEHRDPRDDLRTPYDRATTDPLTKLNALTLMAAEHQTHDYYMNIGPTFADPVARQLYAEIASIEEQHVTQYETLVDPTETWLEKWLLHEASEVYTYWSCAQTESNKTLKALWERPPAGVEQPAQIDLATDAGLRAWPAHLRSRDREGRSGDRSRGVPADRAARPDQVREPARLRVRNAGGGGRPARERHGVHRRVRGGRR